MTVSVFFEDTKLDSEVVMFSGSLSDIPSGWLLCDGSNGTPDLTDRFVKGDATPYSASYATGGQDSYSLSEDQLPSHTHSHGSVGSTGDHSHSANWRNNSGTNYDLLSRNHKTNIGSPGNTTDSVYGGGHEHDTTVSAVGGSSTVDNRPAFYEVAFIMKS
jgi:microcystin-dependent protein